MDDFVTNLLDPSWWIGVVIVGFIINILSSYAKPGIDRIWGHWSVRRRRKLESESRDFNDRVNDLLSNPEKITNIQFDILYYNIRMVFCLVTCLSLGLLIIYIQGLLLSGIFTGNMRYIVSMTIIFLLFGILLFYSAMATYFGRSNYSQILLRETLRRSSEKLTSLMKENATQVETELMATKNKDL